MIPSCLNPLQTMPTFTQNAFSHLLSFTQPAVHTQTNPTGQQYPNNVQSQQFQQFQTATISANNAKFPYLEKEKYEIWAMKMEYWIQNADHNLWRIVQQGNSPKRLGKDAKGNTIVHPPVSLDEHVAVQRENKVRTLLLQALPEDHMPDFHHYDDARDIWLAVKARFGGNEESKKMRKTMLKQQFTEFSVTEEEGLHKGYDRFQKILSQLNQVQARPDNDDINLKFLRALPSSWSQVGLALKTRGGLDSMSFDDLYNKLRSLELDVRIGHSYSVKAAVAPTHSAFIGTTCSGSKPTYSDQQRIVPSVSQTSGRSDNIMECVLHSFVAENEQDQDMIYEDFDQVDQLEMEEMDLKWQMAMLSLRINRFEKKAGRKMNYNNQQPARFDRRKVRCYKCLQLGHFARECNVKTVDDKARYSAFKVTEVKTDEPKALVSVDSMVNWSDHAAENKTGEVEKVYGMMAGLHTDNGGAGVSDAAAEFALMGISPKVQNCPLGCDSKINDLNNMYNNLDRLYNDCYIKVQAYQNAVKTLESQKDWYHKTQIALEEKIRVLSANLENTTNTLSYTEKLHDQAQKEKKEWEVKYEATLARFEKWKESSKNLNKLINSSMSTRTKIGLGFKEYFGEDEVFDLSRPSTMYPEPIEEGVKPLYSRFVKAGAMHAVPPSITGTYMPTPYKSDIEETQVSYGSKSDNKTSETISESNDFVSCDNSDKSSDSETYASCDSSLKTKTKDFPPAVDIKTLPESDVEDPNSTAGSPSFSCSENVKSPRIFCNKSGMNNRNVCKNNYVRVKKCFVCGSKLHLIKDCDFYNCVDSVPCKSKAASVPAGSRNSSASVPADRSDPAASRNRPAVNPADRPHPAGWSKRPATVSAGRPVSAGWLNPAARPFFRPSSVYNTNWSNIYDPMIKGRWGTAVKTSAENTTNTLSYTEKLHDQAQKEKKEWEVKFEATLARFEKWKESSKNLKNLIDSSMSTRTKVGLGFQEYFGVDEVFDLSTPSVFYSDPVEKEVKPLYSTFVKAGEMHAVPPPITGTYMPSPYQSDIEETQVSYGSKSDNNISDTISESNDFVSCDNSDKSSDSETHASCDSSLKTQTKDIPPAVDIQTLPESDVEDPNSTTGSPSFSCSENVKSPRIFCNKSGMNNRNVCKNNSVRIKKCFVCGSKLHLIKDCDFYNCVDSVPCKSKATSVPAGSRNSSAPGTAGGSDPAASRNRPAVKSATPVSAGRPVSASWLNPAARPYFRPSSVYNTNWSNIYDPMIKGQWGTAVKTSAVTILNTSDYLGKFEGKADEGYLVGYASNSKAYRAYNLTNKRVEETMNLRFLEDKPNVQGIGHEWYFDLDYLTDSLGYTRFKTDTPAGTQETNINAGTQDLDSDSEVDEQVIVVPSFPSNSVAGPSSSNGPSVMERNADYAEELAKLQRQEYEAKDAAARYGYLFSQATAEILCQAEAEIRNQGVSAVRDPAGIDSAVRDTAAIDSAGGVSAGSPSAGSDPAGGNPAGTFQPAGSYDPADESNPTVSSSVSADFIPV
ncbi:putative ribonuclease H-like domain-containing protein [Tanacetum coccineum]|uniref:Ribonuclease H-like domain-containing protein n=1 Tax=Tanacetum coccineum TaxID=301880 RepID=A0ABQ5DMM2_9ASTR